DLPAIEGPQLGEFQQQRPGTHGPNARGTLQQVIVFPPHRAGPEQRLEVIVQRSQALVEPGDMCLNVRLETPARPREAVLLRGAHNTQWPAASSEGAQLLRLGGRQRPGRWADHVSTMRQRARNRAPAAG